MPAAPSERPLTFGLPPSLNVGDTDLRLERLGRMLESTLGGTVTPVVVKSYQELARKMQTSELDVAWAPPFVAARLEVLGFRVLLRGVRGGASTYRSALVGASAGLKLEQLKGKRAVWVDRDSVSGYLLPLAFLKEKGFNPATDLSSQEFTGSFVTCVERVLAGMADFTGVFAPPKGERTGLDELAPLLAPRVRVIAFTEEVPTSGLVASGRAPPERLSALTAALEAVRVRPDGAWLINQVFGMDAFEPAPKLGYRALYKLATAAVW